MKRSPLGESPSVRQGAQLTLHAWLAKGALGLYLQMANKANGPKKQIPQIYKGKNYPPGDISIKQKGEWFLLIADKCAWMGGTGRIRSAVRKYP